MMTTKKMVLEKSFEYWKRAQGIIPSGTQTLSKAPKLFAPGSYPYYIKRGKGSHVWDVDGNEYIDWGGALGPIILGYSYEQINKAITRQVEDGMVFTHLHPLEVELAELLTEVIPCCDMARFVKTGSDACSAAVKVARAYTGRDKIISQGYHGWHDWYNITHNMNRGVPKQLQDFIFKFEYNDADALERIFKEHPDEIAAVIIEPVMLEEPKDNFLLRVKEITHKYGALLIFDEIVTGFRFALGGIQELYNVIPDLACFGKAMANGMPISTFVGRKEVMSVAEELFISMTHGGEAVSIAAAIATINELKSKDVIKHVWEVGTKIVRGFEKLVDNHGLRGFVECKGMGPHNVVLFYDKDNINHLEAKTLFLQETAKRGVLIQGVNPNYSHSQKDIDDTLDAVNDALYMLKKAINEGNILKYIEGSVAEEAVRRVED